MFKKISTSYNLVKTSFIFIKRDGELLVYSLFSLFSALIILSTFVGVGFFFFPDIKEGISETNTSSQTQEILFIAFSFIYYLVFSFITFFFNTAIITSVQRRLEGFDNKLGDGLRDSIKYLKQIFIWSLINATVSTILNTLQRSFGENSIVGKIILGLVGGVWNILTFFTFPLMILDNKGPKEAIKESTSLFQQTWGERAIIHVGVGLLFGIIFILDFVIGVSIIISGFIITGIIFILLSVIVLVILSSTCDVIIKTILLSYIKTGVLPSGIGDVEYLKNIASER